MIALNHNTGKPKWSLLLTDFADELREVLRVREVIEASGKYDRMNFAMSQGKPEAAKFLEDNLDSMERHLFDRRADKHTDPETQCFHMAHICVRALIDLSYALREPKESKSTIKDCTDLGAQGDLAVALSRYDWKKAPIGTKYGVTMKDTVCTQLFLKELPVEISYYRNIELAPVQSRYPWKDAPEWATCGAVDSNDIGYFHELKPTVDNSDWSEWSSRGRVQESMSEMLRDGEDWRDTLEMKP
jgi:hypothetical protein